MMRVAFLLSSSISIFTHTLIISSLYTAAAAESGKKRSARRAFHISTLHIFFSLKKCDVLDKTDSPFPRAAEIVNWATEIINKSAEQTAA